MGIAPHYFSTKQVPTCTTAASCNFTTDTNIEEGIGTTGGSSNASGSSGDVSEWAIVTIGLAGSTILGIMLIAYLLCPNLLGGKKKSNYVVNHHTETSHSVLRESNSVDPNYVEIVFQ